MGKLVDNIIAFRLLKMITTPFNKTEAFKLGIIDEKGKVLRRPSKFTRNAEYDAYNYLTRFIFNMKRLINKVGGENQLKSVGAALYLFKEHNNDFYSNDPVLLETLDIELEKKFFEIMNSEDIEIDTSIVEKFFSEDMVTTDSIDIKTPTIQQGKRYKVLKRQMEAEISTDHKNGKKPNNQPK